MNPSQYSHETWLQRALAEGYPVCPECQEPLQKARWIKGIHTGCATLKRQTKDRLLHQMWVERTLSTPKVRP